MYIHTTSFAPRAAGHRTTLGLSVYPSVGGPSTRLARPLYLRPPATFHPSGVPTGNHAHSYRSVRCCSAILNTESLVFSIVFVSSVFSTSIHLCFRDASVQFCIQSSIQFPTLSALYLMYIHFSIQYPAHFPVSPIQYSLSSV